MRTFAKRTLKSHCATFQLFNEIASHKVGIQRLLCVSLRLSAVGDKLVFIFSGCNRAINPFPLMPCTQPGSALKTLAALLGTLIASLNGKQPGLHAGAFICASQTQTSKRITHRRVLDVILVSSHLLYPPAILSASLLITGHDGPAAPSLDCLHP